MEWPSASFRWAVAATPPALFETSRERKLAEELLRESEERFRNLTDYAPESWSTLGQTNYAPSSTNRGSTSPDEPMEDELGNGWAEGVHPEDYGPAVWKSMITSFEAREPFKMEYRLRRYDSEYRWVLDHGIPLFSPNRKDEFLATLAHELRNPLAPIRNAAAR